VVIFPPSPPYILPGRRRPLGSLESRVQAPSSLGRNANQYVCIFTRGFLRVRISDSEYVYEFPLKPPRSA